MSCSCGESKCSCSERCFCLSELCLCTDCFYLKRNCAVKSDGRNAPLESSSDASSVFMKMERSNANNDSKSNEDNKCVVAPSGENLRSDLVSIESDEIKLESKNESSPGFIYPTITFSEWSELGTVPKQQGSAKVGGCSKKENILLKMKSENKSGDLKLCNYKRYFEYFSSKGTDSKRKKRSRSCCRKKGFKMLSRKAKHSQGGKRPASMSQQKEVHSESESNKREVDEDVEYSKFNTFFTDVSSSGYSDYDTDESKSTKTSTTSNCLFSLNMGGSFSEPEATGCELSQSDPCSRCKRKKRMLSYYMSPQINEMPIEASKFQEGPSTSFRDQIDPIPSSNAEKRIKKDATESSTTLGNCPNDTRKLSVYDFDEKEGEVGASDKTLNFRKRSVKIDNSGKLKINIYPTSQASDIGESSQIDSVQNVDGGKMDSQATNDNQYVSLLNASSSAETLNDCVIVHESAGKIRTKKTSKVLRRVRKKRRKTAKSKREVSCIKKKIKKEAKIKSEVKKEKGHSGNETGFKKVREIKKEVI